MMLDGGNDARVMFAQCLGDVQEMLGVESPSVGSPAAVRRAGGGSEGGGAEWERG